MVKAQIPIIFYFFCEFAYVCLCVSYLLAKKKNENKHWQAHSMDSKKDVVIVCIACFANMSNAKILWQTIESSAYEKCNPYYDGDISPYAFSLHHISSLDFSIGHSLYIQSNCDRMETVTITVVCWLCGIVIGFSFEIFKFENNK